LELGNGAWGPETRIMGLPGLRKKFDDIFSRLGTIHERHGHTDGRTPTDSIASRGKILYRPKESKLSKITVTYA